MDKSGIKARSEHLFALQKSSSLVRFTKELEGEFGGLPSE